MKSYDIEQITAQAEEAAGGDKVGFPFKGIDYVMTHPAFLDDDELERVEASVGGIELAVALMGEEQYASYRAAGGKATMVAHLVAKIREEYQAVLADGTPTPSGGSSRGTRKQSKRR